MSGALRVRVPGMTTRRLTLTGGGSPQEPVAQRFRFACRERGGVTGACDSRVPSRTGTSVFYTPIDTPRRELSGLAWRHLPPICRLFGSSIKLVLFQGAPR